MRWSRPLWAFGLLCTMAAPRAAGPQTSPAVELLQSYVGRYELAPGVLFDVDLEDGTLYVRLTGQSRYRVVPESETSFRYEVVDARLTFEHDAAGAVTGLRLSQAGTEQPARKIADNRTAPADAAEQLAGLERRLLGAKSIHMRGEVTATGAYAAALTGTFVVSETNRAQISFSGDLDQAPAGIALVSDGERMAGGAPALEFDLAVPAGLNEALLLGWIRMGLLHNLAALNSGAPPDGGVRDGAVARNVGRGDSGNVAGEDVDVISFDLWVRGELSGHVALWIDRTTGLPLFREQTVEFAGGTMQLVERYSDILLGDEPLSADHFVIPRGAKKTQP